MSETDCLISAPLQRKFANPCFRVTSKQPGGLPVCPALLLPQHAVGAFSALAAFSQAKVHWAFSCLQAVIPAVSFAWNSLPLVLSVVGWLLSFMSPFRCHLHPTVVALVTHLIPAFYSLSPQSRNHHVDTFAWLLFACWPPCGQGPRQHHSLLFSGKIRSQWVFAKWRNGHF